MTDQSFRQRMQAGQPQIGIRSQLCSPLAAEALGWCGADYVYIDMEHAPNDLMLVVQQCQALAPTPARPVVRLPSNDGVLIQRLLDAGVENIVVPMVETAEEAERVVAAASYPPRGNRGAAGGHRGNRFGLDSGYNADIASRMCLVVQVESRRGLRHVAEIAAVDGIDGVLFGPADIAADLGHLGEPTHPEVAAAIAAGIAEVRKAGKFPGMSTNDAAKGRDWIAKGCRFVSVGGDIPILVRNVRQLVQAFADLRPAANP